MAPQTERPRLSLQELLDAGVVRDVTDRTFLLFRKGLVAVFELLTRLHFLFMALQAQSVLGGAQKIAKTAAVGAVTIATIVGERLVDHERFLAVFAHILVARDAGLVGRLGQQMRIVRLMRFVARQTQSLLERAVLILHVFREVFVTFQADGRAFAADQEEAIILAVNRVAFEAVLAHRLVLDFAQLYGVVAFQTRLVCFVRFGEDVFAANRLMARLALVLGCGAMPKPKFLQAAVAVGRNTGRADIEYLQFRGGVGFPSRLLRLVPATLLSNDNPAEEDEKRETHRHPFHGMVSFPAISMRNPASHS